jgi:autotransporter-associated beta strand protein
LGQSGLSGIQFDSGILGLTAESGNFTRTIGNTNGNGTRLGSTSLDKGFAAFGGNRSIVFNNSATTTINLGFNQQITGGLILGHSSADSTITFVNPLGLYVADTRNIIVNNGSAAIDGVVSGNITTASGAWTAASIFQINGNGTLAFTGTANTFGNGSAAGQTFLAINQATLQIGNNGTTGMIGSGANATVQGDIQNDGVLRIALTSNQTINNIIKGNGSFSNVSTGRIALNGANTYTGNTTVSAGTLALGSGGSIANSSLITVVAGATLDVASAPGGFVLGASQTLTGSGSVVGSATINGHLRPSSSPGVLSFSSDLTLGSGANLQMEINGNGTRGIAYDGINVAGALTYGGSLELVIDSPFAPGDYTFDLLSGFSSQTGNFTSVSLSGAYAGSFLRTGEVWELTSSGNTWTLDQLSGDLAVSVVPEPSTWALLALAVGTLLLTRARRRKSSSSP